MGNVSNLALAREARRPQESPSHGGKGYALLHRKIRDLPFYKKGSEAVHLWLHLILSANYESTIVTTDYGDVVVERGQAITSGPCLEAETGIELERVKYLLKKFKKEGMISTYSPGKFTVITITKYNEYQGGNTVKMFPQVSPEIPSEKPEPVRATGESFPHDSLKVPTKKEVNNITLPIGSVSPSAAEKPERQKPALSCQDVIDAYHEILPEAKSVRALTEKRRSSIKTFWRKAGVVTRQLDGHGFTMEDWRKYLAYVRDNCRWMFEERQNPQRGTVWHSKGFDYLLNDNVYLKVREGDHDDR